jgi:hypothetical protein
MTRARLLAGVGANRNRWREVVHARIPLSFIAPALALPALATAAPAAADVPVGPVGPPPPARHLIVGFKKNVSSDAQKRLIAHLKGKGPEHAESPAEDRLG